MDIIELIKTAASFIPLATNTIKFLRGFVGDAKDLYDTGEEVLKPVLKRYAADTTAILQSPHGEGIDLDRIDALTELNRSVVPFAWIEFIYYLTKLIFMAIIYSIFVQFVANLRTKKSKDQ